MYILYRTHSLWQEFSLVYGIDLIRMNAIDEAVAGENNDSVANHKFRLSPFHSNAI